MGWFDKPKEERQANIARHRLARKAAEQAARAHPDEHMVHHQLNEEIIDAERDIPWWRR